jgi:protoporphyrinogen oxidase
MRKENSCNQPLDACLMQIEPIAVLGGGLAGLCASMVARAAVFEADERFGGVANSDSRDGFVFDRGIHVLQTRNPRILQLLAELGVELNHHERHGYIHSHGTFTPYPFQVNTAGMPLRLRARCVWSYLTRDRKIEPRNYEEWMYATLGRGFADTFLIPYSEKFWTVHPREMTHEWTGNRVPPSDALKVIRGAVWAKRTPVGTNAEFRYPTAGGYGAIAAALQTRAGALHPGHRASKIDLDNRTVHFDNGRSLRYERLISTIPLPRLLRLCGEIPQAVQEAASRLRTNSIRVVNLGLGGPAVRPRHWVHFPEKDVSFFRISFPSNFAADLAPHGNSSISAEVAYRAGESPDDARLVERVRADLERVGLLRKDDRVIHTSTHDIPFAYCIYDVHRKASVRAIREWLVARNVHPAGRYGLWSYFWSDESMMSGLQTGENVLRSLQGAPDAAEGHVVAAD